MKYALLLIAFLLVSILCIGQPLEDEWDPIDNTWDGATLLGRVTENEQTHGPHTLSGTDTQDWFQFTLEAGEEYEWYSSGGLDTAGEIVDSDGSTQLATDDDGGLDFNFSLRFRPERSGLFYLRVQQFDLSAEGTYFLHYKIRKPEPQPGDAWDPADDNFTSATDLGIPTTTAQDHGPHTLSTTDYYDWFQFSLSEAIVYEFASTGDFDTFGDLYKADGTTRVASDDDGGNSRNFMLTFTPNESGLYYLRVKMFEEGESGSYSLVFQSGAEPPPAGDSWDPADDIREGAPQLDAPTREEQTHGTHTLSDTDSFDWFHFVITEGALYEFWSSGESDTYAELYEANGTTPLTFDNDSGENKNFRIAFEPTTAGKYYLRVQAYTGDAAEYVLHYQKVRDAPAPVLDTWDPRDNQRENATQLGIPTIAEQRHGWHTLSLDDTDDWFHLTLLPGDSYQIRTSGNSDTYGVLYGPESMTPVASNDDDGSGYNFMLRFTPEVGGAYSLLVSTYPAGNNASYMLHYSVETEPSPNGDRWDPSDDQYNDATDLGYPSGIEKSHGPHSLSVTDEADWFQFTLREGASCEFLTLRDSDTVGELFFFDGTSLATWDDDSGTHLNFHIRYTAPQSGIYYLRVKESSGEDAEYTLHWRGEETSIQQLEPIRSLSFDSEDGITEVPGGFIEAESGRWSVGSILSGDALYTDGQGVTLTTAPGEVELLLFPQLEVGDGVVLVRASVQASAAGAAVGLAVLDGNMDHSLATNIPADSGIFQNGYQRMMIVYDPPGTSVVPAFQLANLTGDREVSVYLDNLEIFLLPEEGDIPTSYFYPKEMDAENNQTTPTILETYEFDQLDEFSRLPGGFIEVKGGSTTVGFIPPDTGLYTDGHGAYVRTKPGEVELLMFPEIDVGDRVLLIRASVQSTGKNAEIGLAALDGAWDQSIATNIVANSAAFQGKYQRMMIVYDPPGNLVIPAFQLANIDGIEDVAVYLDRLEIYALEKEGLVPARFFYGE